MELRKKLRMKERMMVEQNNEKQDKVRINDHRAKERKTEKRN